MNERERIGERVSELRKNANYTQEKLAELSGLSRSHIVRIENGYYNFNIETLSKIASVFDCKIDFVPVN